MLNCCFGFFCSSYTVENDKEGIGSNLKKKRAKKWWHTKVCGDKNEPLMVPFPPALRRCCSLLLQPCGAVTVVPKMTELVPLKCCKETLNPAACIAMQPATQSAYEFLRVISIILSYCLHLWPLTIKLVQPWEVHEAREHFNVAIRFRGLSQDIFSGAECKQSADSLTGSSFFFWKHVLIWLVNLHILIKKLVQHIVRTLQMCQTQTCTHIHSYLIDPSAMPWQEIKRFL